MQKIFCSLSEWKRKKKFKYSGLYDCGPIVALCSRAVALLQPSGTEQDLFILLRSSSFHQLLPYLLFSLCKWNSLYQLRAWVSCMRGPFESIPSWIIVQVKAQSGGKQSENGLTCGFEFRFKYQGKLVHLEMLCVAECVSVWI